MSQPDQDPDNKWSQRAQDAVDAGTEIASDGGNSCWPDSCGLDGCGGSGDSSGGDSGSGGCDSGGCDGPCMVALLPFWLVLGGPVGWLKHRREQQRRRKKKDDSGTGGGCDSCAPDCDFCLLSVPMLALVPASSQALVRPSMDGTSLLDAGAAVPAAGVKLVARAEPSVPARAGLAAIRLYQRRISPRLPIRCRYSPSCSAYGADAVRRYGLRTGTALAGARIRRCTRSVPRGTVDPVP